MKKPIKIAIAVLVLVFLGVCVLMYADNFRARYATYSDVPEGARSWHVFGESVMLEAKDVAIDADVDDNTFKFSFVYPKDKFEQLVDSIPSKVSAREEKNCSGIFKSFTCYKFGMKSPKTIKLTVARREALALEDDISYWLLDPETGNVAGWSAQRSAPK